jgi:hypothetical protein
VTAVVVEHELDVETVETVEAVAAPCLSSGCKSPAAVVVVWSDPTPHRRRIPLCDRCARILLDAFDTGHPPRCEVCLQDADVVEVRALTP